MAGPVVVLAGGTGGAKLARGMLDVVGDDLVVVANTGDDVEIYGSYVSPDPDLIAFWLADRIDERGWGLEGDTFAVMDALRALGEDVWFNLGDADLAWCLERARRMREGETATTALAALTAAIGVRARVLPMSDAPVRTRVHARGSWTGLQEFLIRQRGEGPVEDVAFDGAAEARISDEVAAALARAEAIVIGPSNPIISIRPILSVSGMAAALRDSPAPVVAISPIVAGQVLKGPTAAFMQWAGRPLTSAGIAALYGDVADALLADEDDGDCALPVRIADTLMADAAGRRRVASEALALARAVRMGS